MNGSGFPVDACALLEVAWCELVRARDELAAAKDAVSWVSPTAGRFREAADAQWATVAILADACAAAVATLRWQGSVYAVDAGSRA